MRRLSAILLATLLMFVGCGRTDSCACSTPMSFSTDHALNGRVGEPAAVVWMTGTGRITLERVEWSHPPKRPGDTLLMLEMNLVTETGTINNGWSYWIAQDVDGRHFAAGDLLDDPTLPVVAEKTEIVRGTGVRGWFSVLFENLLPLGPIEIFVVEYETQSRLVTWTVPGPSEALK